MEFPIRCTKLYLILAQALNSVIKDLILPPSLPIFRVVMFLEIILVALLFLYIKIIGVNRIVLLNIVCD